jgi:hypothetical protein
METSENPLRSAYWLGETDPRPLALFRIAFGMTVLHDLANYAVDLRAFVTDEGMLPRGVQDEPRVLSLFDGIGTPFAAACLLAVGVAAAIAFTVGYRTRLATILTWLFLTSLHTRNLYVTDGGDDLVRNMMFLSMFADLGASFSFDARKAQHTRRDLPPSGTALAEGADRTRRTVAVVGLRFLQLHIGLLYFCAGRLKFRAGWLSHNVVYQCLQLTGFVRPPGHWLLSFPSLCFALGVVIVLLEFAFVFLAFSPWQVARTRALAIAGGLAVQLGILASMRVGVFTESMIVSMALFLQPAWLDRLAPRIGWLARPVLAPPASAAAALPFASTAVASTGFRFDALRARKALLAVLSIHFLALVWGPFIGRRIPPPSWLTVERHWLWLDQPFGLFDVVYDVPRWEVTGYLADGREVDVLPYTVPALVPAIAWSFSRWYKFTFKERERPFPFHSIGDFFCAEYRRATRSKLASLAIFESLTPPVVPPESPLPATRRERFRTRCAP